MMIFPQTVKIGPRFWYSGHCIGLLLIASRTPRHSEYHYLAFLNILTSQTSKNGGVNSIKNIWIPVTHTNAVVESITTVDERSLNAVVKKHPNVSAANTVSVNANIVLALAKNVFIFA